MNLPVVRRHRTSSVFEGLLRSPRSFHPVAGLAGEKRIYHSHFNFTEPVFVELFLNVVDLASVVVLELERSEDGVHR